MSDSSKDNNLLLDNVQLSSTYVASTFGRLASLGESDSALSADGLKHSRLEELKGLIRQHNLCNVVGVQLLHSHFVLADNERLVESPLCGTDDGGARLVSENVPATVDASAKCGLLTHIWCSDVDEDGAILWRPLEFVNSEALSETEVAHMQDKIQRLLKEVGFLSAFARRLKQIGMEKTCGLGLFMDSEVQAKRNGEMVIESSKSERHLVVKAVKVSDANNAGLIAAFWTGHHDDDEFYCQRWCTPLPTPPFHMTTHRG